MSHMCVHITSMVHTCSKYVFESQYVCTLYALYPRTYVRVHSTGIYRWPLAIPSVVNMHVCVVYMHVYVRVGTSGKHARVCVGM